MMGKEINFDVDNLTIIKPESSWDAFSFKELKRYRDLFYFLVWRDIKVLYAQTILGLLWAILQPTIQIVIFTVIFGKIAKVPSEGIPYMVFATAAIIPWTYMSQAMTTSSHSLITNQGMLGKIYFPRIIFPVTPVLAKLIDFGISMIIVVGICVYYKIWPSWNIVFLPFFILYMVCVAMGVGIWMASWAIRFRDVRLAMPFVIRMLMYTGPIVYSAASIPEKYRIIYSLNPIVGVIEGFRASLLGLPFDWQYILPGVVTTVLLLIIGLFNFKKMEKVFVDVI